MKHRRIHIVKRHGHSELFDERKIYGSVYAAALTVHKGKKAEAIAREAADQVKTWAYAEKEVSSDAIFRKIISMLNKIDKEVAFMYETHLDIS